MLQSLTALSLCEIALQQITTAAASEVDQRGEGGEKFTSLRGSLSLYSSRPKRDTRDWN